MGDTKQTHFINKSEYIYMCSKTQNIKTKEKKNFMSGVI